MKFKLSSEDFLTNIEIEVSKEKFRELLESYIKNYGIGDLFHILGEIMANNKEFSKEFNKELTSSASNEEDEKVSIPNAPLSENKSLNEVQEKPSASLEKASDTSNALNNKEISPEVPDLTPAPAETNIPKTELGANIYAPNYIGKVAEDSKKNPQNFVDNIPVDIPVIDTPKVKVLERGNYPDAKTVAPGEINY